MVDFKERAERKDEERVRKDTRDDSEHDGECIVFELGELPVERNRERDCTRCHEVVEEVCAREVLFVRDFESGEHDDDHRARHQKRREEEKLRLFVNYRRNPIAHERNAQPERHGI